MKPEARAINTRQNRLLAVFFLLALGYFTADRLLGSSGDASRIAHLADATAAAMRELQRERALSLRYRESHLDGTGGELRAQWAVSDGAVEQMLRSINAAEQSLLRDRIARRASAVRESVARLHDARMLVEGFGISSAEIIGEFNRTAFALTSLLTAAADGSELAPLTRALAAILRANDKAVLEHDLVEHVFFNGRPASRDLIALTGNLSHDLDSFLENANHLQSLFFRSSTEGPYSYYLADARARALARGDRGTNDAAALDTWAKTAAEQSSRLARVAVMLGGDLRARAAETEANARAALPWKMARAFAVLSVLLAVATFAVYRPRPQRSRAAAPSPRGLQQAAEAVAERAENAHTAEPAAPFASQPTPAGVPAATPAAASGTGTTGIRAASLAAFEAAPEASPLKRALAERAQVYASSSVQDGRDLLVRLLATNPLASRASRN